MAVGQGQRQGASPDVPIVSWTSNGLVRTGGVESHVRCEEERTVGDRDLQSGLKGSHSLGWETWGLGGCVLEKKREKLRLQFDIYLINIFSKGQRFLPRGENQSISDT
jgi:hypothetical protein